VNIIGSEFVGNSAELGGALFVQTIELVIKDSKFNANTAKQQGGAIASLALGNQSFL